MKDSYSGIIVHGLDDLDGQAFEKLCATILQRRGYHDIHLTRSVGDYGVDILASSMGLKYAIQCKRAKNKIGNKAIQEVLSGMIYYKCDCAVVVTNSYFTKQAIETAKATGVVLWDRNTLINMMYESKLRIEKKPPASI